MKINLFCIIFCECIYISLSFVPLWNFDNSAIKLFPDLFNKRYKYTPCNKDIYQNIKMNDELIVGNDDTFTYQNYIYINGEKLPANYTDVESAYEITEGGEKFYYVCPKGKFHLHRYKYYNDFIIIKPDGFNEVDDWELKCYYHPDEHFLFVSYLKSKNDFYQYDLKKKDWREHKPLYDGIYDFKWNVHKISDSNSKKQMFAILKKGNQLRLYELHFDVYDGQNFNVFDKQKRTLAELKSNYDAFFSDNKDVHNFYWINYNETYFSSGYYNGTEKITEENFNKITIVNNTDNSPLEFYEKISIEEMHFISYTKYVYYKIYNEGKRKYYHGIIDIVQNKVIYNTDEPIKNFFPLSNKAMYVSTFNNYYQICIIKNNNNEQNKEEYDDYECADKCSNGEILIYDTATVNRCGNKCNTNYILQPEDICINGCDENIYTINGNQCGYCKDIDPNGHKYKLVGEKNCLKEKPANSYYINEKYKLIACKDGIEFKDGKCGDGEEKNCYKNCEECSGESTDPKAQKCTSCKSNFVLDGENCKCPDHYFEKDNKCEKCSDACKSCESNEDYCTSCNNGEYLEENKCKKCHEDCNTCKKGVENDIQNCLSCNTGKYLYNYSCLQKCPENTTAQGNECITMNTKKENIDENEPIMLIIFIIITAIILAIIIICFFKKACSSNEDEEIVNQIYTELS